MDFGFSEQQRDVQNLARQILSENVSAEKLSQYDDYKAERFDRELWQKLAEAGLLGVAVSEEYGGMGFGFFELGLLVEEAGRTIAPLPLVSHLISAALPIQQFGSTAQKQQWLPGVASGELMLTAALCEAYNDDPAQPYLTTASADGDGLLLNGEKTNVPFAHIANRILLAARTNDGIAVVLLDPKAAGVSLTAQQVTSYEPQYVLHLDNVRIGAGDILATGSDGSAAMQWIAERSTVALCAHQLGASDKAMRMSASYTAERKQFGVLISTFQAVGHRAANCFIDVECLRLNTYQAISRLDGGLDATNEVQIAKIWAGDVGHRVSYAAQHLHGGTGIDRDYPLWRYCTWLRHNEMALGSSAKTLAKLGKRIAAGEAFCS
ncbi:acyl-CoA dehydrogenase family protein [uncultured Zhongshania sp.]|jgi:alkylation response protein AidB-like acyl-CoA dehydrogenase|uniref:acyl-CoA dehydrogenase family protein n=1 Tax=uncultured Zhongshania sp. TaxID=1642288 RepID=UPI0025D491E4|nr:acyl-CoA dehydrogenase family protein [uncultured Zhongshania sp.]|tara:strand:+ start:3342 stop:4478 length:1137 start_codon:yes stop_codon:yes gene_type:complete